MLKSALHLSAITALALALTGCFISRGDLITPREADFPLASGTRITIYALNDKGTRREGKPEHAILTRDGEFYRLTPEGDEPLTGLIDAIGENLFAAMLHDTEHPGASLYGLFVREGNVWRRYGIVCSDFAKLAEAHGKPLGTFGIANANGDCLFTSYGDLQRALLFARNHMSPDAEYVIGE